MNRILVILFCVAAAWAFPVEEEVSATIFHKKVPANEVPINAVGGRIINGSPASSGQIPWQVALYLSVSGGTSFCGGSLISTTWVLTAAHCAQGVSAVTIYLGVTSLSNTAGRVTRQASRAIVHGSYSSSSLQNDIALLQFSQSVTVSNTVRAISLATSALGNSVTVTASGWGRTSDSSNAISQTLNYVSLSTITNAVCGNTYGTIHAGIVCAQGSNTASTCNGDSGGPLVTGSGTGATLHGAVSFGSAQGCARGYPVGFARVAYYRSWISSNSGV